MQPTIHVIGHSCRSLAQSLVHAGYPVVAFDDYQDRDLSAIAECHPMANFAEYRPVQAGLSRPQQTGPSQPMIMLAGGMENRIAMLREIETRYQVLGPTANAIAAIRDMRVIQDLADRASIGFPEVRDPDFRTTPSFQADWIWKPFRSGGGQSIFRMSENSRTTLVNSSGGYWQRFIQGNVISATWLINSLHAELLASCTSVTNTSWPIPTEFGYRGSLFGSELNIDQIELLVGLGQLVRQETNYRGLLQADLVLDNDGKLWLLEFNPRWAASFEVIERSLHRNLATMHLAACDPVLANSKYPVSEVFPASFDQATGKETCGKAILYAPHDLVISQASSDWLFAARNGWSLPSGQECFVADIPPAGTNLQAGQPIVSLLACGKSHAGVLESLGQAQVLVLDKIVRM
jgi:uncharacterized protein